jgi:glucose-1-phosphate cytidylyltransferase
MKTIILAGGRGTRLAETLIPKPLIEVKGIPIIYRVIHHYVENGFDDFIIAGGYKIEKIIEYFDNHKITNIKYEIIDTGLNTPTGGRVKFLQDKIDDDFMVTYADGISDVPIQKIVDFHKFNDRIATITAVHPPARFGQVVTGQDDGVVSFAEKEQVESGWVNGGFMVFKPAIFDYLKEDEPLEKYTLSNLSKMGQLSAYRYFGFWQCVDTSRDVEYLNELLAK